MKLFPSAVAGIHRVLRDACQLVTTIMESSGIMINLPFSAATLTVMRSADIKYNEKYDEPNDDDESDTIFQNGTS